MQEHHELFPGGIHYAGGAGVFPISTDTMVLAAFVKLPSKARVLDLGSAAGALGLMLCGTNPGCTVCGIEQSPDAHAAALRNIEANGLSARMESICANVRDARQLLEHGSFSCAVMNPPYFPAGPGESAARKELAGTLEDFFAAAAWAVKFGGDLFLVHRPERMADLMALGRQYALEPKELRFVRHNAAALPALVLMKCRKGAKPGLALLSDLILRNADGSETPEYRTIYHLPERRTDPWPEP